MNIAHPGVVALAGKVTQGASSTARSTAPVPFTHGLLKLPSVDDIAQLTEQVQEITHAISYRLNESKWKRTLTLAHRSQFESSINQFRTFCEEARVLLQDFSKLSRSFAALFESISCPEFYSSIEPFAIELLSQTGCIYNQISSVERRYTTSISQLRHLISIAPLDSQQHLQCLEEDQAVFQRLDALWRVVSTQLSSVLEGRMQPPHPDIGHNAKIKWEEYDNCLEWARDILEQSADALEPSKWRLQQRLSLFALGARFVGKVLLWFRLMRGRPTGKPKEG